MLMLWCTTGYSQEGLAILKDTVIEEIPAAVGLPAELDNRHPGRTTQNVAGIPNATDDRPHDEHVDVGTAAEPDDMIHDHNPVGKDAPTSLFGEPLSRLDIMRFFMDSQQAKRNQIRLLNMEIEKKQRELQALEIQSQINSLKKEGGLRGPAMTDPDFIPKSGNDTVEALKLVLTYLVHSENFKEVFISVNGNLYKAQEGDTIDSKVTVLNINKDTCLIQMSNGEQVLLSMNQVVSK